MSMYGYAANQPQTPRTVEGIRMCSSVYVGILFAVCTALVLAYKINKAMTHQIADELAERRRKFAAA
jgi:Na+/melibiose symporter-like transporter